MISVKVPASTANLGAGFDCMGVALKLYNIIEVEECESGLHITSSPDDESIAKDESNLVYKAMKTVFDEVGWYPKGLKINLINEIPLTRGLGSSAACISGGIYAANLLCGGKLSEEEMIFLAAKMEGHPDNSTPAMIGGFVIAVMDEKKVHYIKFVVPQRLKFAVFIPDFPLSTEFARNILPKRIDFKDAVYNIGRSTLFASSILTGYYEFLKEATKDKLHQQYRKKMIPDFDKIINISMDFGAKGSFLSGAGPSIIALIDENYEEFETEVNKKLTKLVNNWKLLILDADNNGANVFSVQSRVL
ncbi:homoserine kinase [Caldicellulosiruptoraceae bacterium PP1]